MSESVFLLLSLRPCGAASIVAMSIFVIVIMASIARFVLRYSEDWFVSFGVENDVATTLTIANAFPNAEIGTFRRSE